VLGLLADLPRKNCWTIADLSDAAVDGAGLRRRRIADQTSSLGDLLALAT
jgi:hypothetical protein